MEAQDAEVSVPEEIDSRVAASKASVLEEVGAAPSNNVEEKKYAESDETKKRGRKRKEAEKENDDEESADREEKTFRVFVKTLTGKLMVLDLKWIGNTLEGLKFDDTNLEEEEINLDLEDLNDPNSDVRAVLSNALALRMKEREGWSRKFTEALCRELFHFLELKATLGDFEGCEFSPPTSLMDDLWHKVILNTKLYRRLCATLPNNPEGKLVDHTTFGAAVDLEEKRELTRKKLTNLVDLTHEWDWSLWFDDAKPEVRARTEGPEGHFTVLELMKMIEASAKPERIPPDQQRLVYGNQLLEPYETFKRYNPEPGITIHLVLKLTGC